VTIPDTLSHRFFKVLVEEIRARRPDDLRAPFTVAEIYQNLIPYRTHRDRLGVEINGDYENTILHLLAGPEDYLIVDSPHALREMREELAAPNPNTGLYREYAAADVRVNPEKLASVEAVGPSTGEAAPTHQVELMEMDAGRPPVPSPGGVAEVTAAGNGVEEPPVARVAPAAPAAPVAPTVPGIVSTVMDGDGVAHPSACRWCGGSLPGRPDVNFCPFCGTDIRVVPCPTCGEELSPDWRFCIACGTEAAG